MVVHRTHRLLSLHATRIPILPAIRALAASCHCCVTMINEVSPFKNKDLMARLLVKADAQWSTPTTAMRFLSESSTD